MSDFILNEFILKFLNDTVIVSFPKFRDPNLFIIYYGLLKAAARQL